MNEQKNLWEKFVDTIVDSLGYAIVRFAPVIAPIPSIAVILEVSGYSAFAWFTVVTIEMVGYAIGDKMVESVRRNVLGMNRAILPIIVYALVIEGLMLGYKVIPAWTGNFLIADAVRASVSMLYPFFTLAGAGLYAFHEYLKEVAADTNYDKKSVRKEKESGEELDREFERQKRQADMEAYRAKLAQDADLERERAMVELRIKEQKAAVKVESASVKSSVKSSANFTQPTGGEPVKFDTPDAENFTDNKADNRRKLLLDLLSEIDGQESSALNKSALAKRLNVSRPTLLSDLTILQGSGKLSLNGHVKINNNVV